MVRHQDFTPHCDGVLFSSSSSFFSFVSLLFARNAFVFRLNSFVSTRFKQLAVFGETLASLITIVCSARHHFDDMDVGENFIAGIYNIDIGTHSNGHFIYRWPKFWCSIAIIAMAGNARNDWIWHAVCEFRWHRFQRLHST